jgi:hypothetical protein
MLSRKAKRQPEPRRRQNAAGFNPKGFGVRLAGSGADRHDVLQLLQQAIDFGDDLGLVLRSCHALAGS